MKIEIDELYIKLDSVHLSKLADKIHEKYLATGDIDDPNEFAEETRKIFNDREVLDAIKIHFDEGITAFDKMETIQKDKLVYIYLYFI